MTKVQEQYEAKITQAQAQVKALAEGSVYSVPSATESAPHILTVVDGKVQSCTCKGWKYCGHCYHAKATERHIEAQSVVKVAAEYIKLSKGGTVRKDSQVRTPHQGFSLYR